MKTLILTPNKTEMCGMYQLAKDLAKEIDGSIMTKEDYHNSIEYDKVISFLYPMHHIAKTIKENYGTYWICYNQGIPPITKTYFPDFWRRQAIRYINWRNNITTKGADEYWDITEREQKPRWTKKSDLGGLDIKKLGFGDYVLYLGRTTDYKNFEWLQKTMQELKIKLHHPKNVSDKVIHHYLSNAKMLVTASIWEGYGRTVMEAEALGIPAVAYDVGAHKKHIKKGICVTLDLNNMKKSEELFKKAILEVWEK